MSLLGDSSSETAAVVSSCIAPPVRGEQVIDSVEPTRANREWSQKGSWMSSRIKRLGYALARGEAVSRRSVLGGMAATGLVGALGVPAQAAVAETGALSRPQQEMALRVTSVVAQFPIEFPTMGERLPVLGRVDARRLSVAAGTLTPDRLLRVRAAADGLIAAGLLESPPAALVNVLGDAAATQSPVNSTPLVALAVATLNRNADPNSDGFADVWIGMVARMHEQHTLASAVAGRRFR